ncbi:LOW QUALITY PROTEIN: hypothetical protein PHMEG_0007188 [Phytophthora megakarya]|uniref:PiggyBac transposable element-derived protein domain-containing protein n=1 Tax=Phytophthora megakarya TaxID=4795 RepID=A0A225WM05_9STRA|nr:LOW QUALITY PROTEIN: hypothetical protein PHMEG_0007188 [Phytophthora megakarya]
MEMFMNIWARFFGAWQPIEPSEVFRVMTLLIARMLVPIRKGIAAHWSMKTVGALRTNRFGKFMSKNRFFHVMGYLHFSNIKSPQARLDRIQKIRPVVDVLQRLFSREYNPPSVISFGEATLLSRSRFNPTRQFNKDKPYKEGTKVFVACDAETAYCMRIEVYCGAKTHLQTPVPQDNNCGEAAVRRKINALLPPSQNSPWLCGSLLHFREAGLLHRRMYITGTIGVDRSGYAQGVVTSKKYKTMNKQKVMVPPQGIVKLVQNKKFPQITAAISKSSPHALKWWKQKIGYSGQVHRMFISISCYTNPKFDCIVDQRIHGVIQGLSAPGLVKDYHKRMGGVDVHEQLRMQRYSIQLGYKSRKYYRTLFLGILDMALVNAFIVRRYYRKVNNRHPAKHFAFYEELIEQLLAVDTKEAFDEIATNVMLYTGTTSAQDRTAQSPSRAETILPSRQVNGIDESHELHEKRDTVNSEKGSKGATVLANTLYKVKPRKFTKYYCPECSIGNKRCLCNVEREGRASTCFRIWHAEWNNGNDIPAGHKTCGRPPTSRPGKKRRRRREAGAESDGGEGNVGDEVSDNESGNDGGIAVMVL